MEWTEEGKAVVVRLPCLAAFFFATREVEQKMEGDMGSREG